MVPFGNYPRFCVDENTKDIELRIPYENKEECLKASKKIDFSFKFPGKI